ncbi:hypothetical protein J6590_099527 [Homalodisca vitripennis]|nr:hypothetical protein J6590_099527 [Homalodisca vitripennis]
MNAYLLKNEDNQYELKIRGQPTSGTAEDLRKRLTKCVKAGTPIDQAVLASLNVDEELEACEDKYKSLAASANEYDGDYTDTEGQRLQARMWHNYLRAGRIPIGALGDKIIAKRHEVLMDKTKELCDAAEAKKDAANAEAENSTAEQTPRPKNADVHSPPEATSHITVGALARQIDSTIAITPQQNFNLTSSAHSRGVPLYKWGLQFDGQSKSVGAFLQRAEEVAEEFADSADSSLCLAKLCRF